MEGAVQGGGAWSGPVPAPRRDGPVRRLRRLARRHPFKLVVLLPTLLARPRR